MNKNQVIVYNSLKCNELAPIVEPKPPVMTLVMSSNPKPSPRITSGISEKEVHDNNRSRRVSLSIPRDGTRANIRSSYGTRKIKVSETT